MGLVKFINQIRTKIVENANGHHFWSIVFQCPIQDQAIMLIPDQDLGQPRYPNHLKLSPSIQGSAQLSVHSMINQVTPQSATTYILVISYHGLLTKVSVLTEHAYVFQGLRKFPGSTMRLHLKEGYKAASRGI